MPTNVHFSTIRAYLDGILTNAVGDIASSPHGKFWNTTYNDFVNGTVPGTHCQGQPIPLIEKSDPGNSAFFLILQHSWCNKPQMPAGGAFVTEAGYRVTLADGTTVTGEKILSDIHEWLLNGFPE